MPLNHLYSGQITHYHQPTRFTKALWDKFSLLTGNAYYLLAVVYAPPFPVLAIADQEGSLYFLGTGFGKWTRDWTGILHYFLGVLQKLHIYIPRSTF